MSTPSQPWSPEPSGPQAPSGPGSTFSAYGAPAGYGNPSTPPPSTNHGAAPARPAGPTGELVVDLRKPVGATGMISPVVTIDGYPAPCSWGRNSFVVPAGTRRVDVAQTYLWTYGRASLPVQVAPGASVDVFYAGPMATFMRGAIGTQPQRRPAQGFFIAMMVVLAVCVLVGVLAAVVGNM